MDWTPLWISLKTAASATACSFLLAIPLARYSASKRWSRGAFWDTAMLFPVALPPTVVGLILLTIFGHQSPVGSAMERAGFFLLFTWPAVVLACTVMSFPILYQAARGAFALIERDLLDNARISGFSETRILFQLMIPLAWPGIAAGSALAFLRALGEFGATLMLAGNIPGRTQTAPLAIYSAIEAGDQHTAWLLAGLILLVSAVALASLQHFHRRFSAT